jgi:hypothetical protein
VAYCACGRYTAASYWGAGRRKAMRCTACTPKEKWPRNVREVAVKPNKPTLLDRAETVRRHRDEPRTTFLRATARTGKGHMPKDWHKK